MKNWQIICQIQMFTLARRIPTTAKKNIGIVVIAGLNISTKGAKNEVHGRMSNDYKACPFAKELCLQGENGEPRKTVGWLCSADCDKCPAHNPARNGYNSVFNQITQSPEVLAPLLVREYWMADGPHIVKMWVSKIVPDHKYKTEAEAIIATVARLKEVYNETTSN